MTDAVVVHSALADSAEAGSRIGRQVAEAFGGERPDALVLFASARHDYPQLLRAIDEGCRPKVMVGCSSAGEFMTGTRATGAVSALALRSPEMRFTAAVGRGLRLDRTAAANQIVSSFTGRDAREYRYRSALVLTDALAGHADDLVEQLTLLTAGRYQFFGGGAGDDARFQTTHVFLGTEAVPDAAVALEILSHKPVAIGVRHGWEPAGPPLRVTRAEGMRIVSLNGAPAVEAFQAHASRTGARFDLSDPMPFFLHNVIGVDTGGGYRLRVPLAVGPEGSIECAADVPQGATVRIMSTTGAAATDAARSAMAAAKLQLEGHKPKVALFFDCVATRLRMGQDFGLELDAVQDALGPSSYAGFNTYGQIARAEGQFGGFHNCTAVVCLIPE